MFLEEEAVPFELPVFGETGFTADEIQELLSLFQTAGDHDSFCQSSVSDESSRSLYTFDERKQRRKISNRESAKRSRYRKKKHLENLTDLVNRLSAENQELKDKLSLILNECYVALRENDRLSSEYVALRARLSDLYRVLCAMPMPMHMPMQQP